MSVLRYFITSKAKRNLLKFFFSRNGDFYTRELARLTGEPLNAVRRELGYMEKAGLLHSYMQGNQKYYRVMEDFPLLAEWKRVVLETDDTATPAQKPAMSAPLEEADELDRVLSLEGQETHPLDYGVIVPGSNVIMKHTEEIESEEETSGLEETAAAEEEGQEQEQPAADVMPFVDYLKERFADVNQVALAVVHGEAARSEEIPAEGVDLLVVGDISKDSLLELIADIEDRTGLGINLIQMTRSDFDYRNAKGDPLMRRMWSEKKLVIKGRQ
ncbi:MAG: winged helix-turn-helix transcriptional regulator [Dehalococcoidia bacterium]|nr:winged helix-turn-helix transcriptional regulator [Dehalococcoidia bacterium]